MDIGGGVSDLFAGIGAGYKAQGDLLEQQNYLLAAKYAKDEETYSQWSTNIQEAQQTREITQSLGKTQADVAGGGFALSGSNLDILRDSASQGALTKAVLGEQGLISEAGYEEQAQSYMTMASAAGMAAQAEKTAETGDFITGAIKGIAGIASIALAPATGGASFLPSLSFLTNDFNPAG